MSVSIKFTKACILNINNVEYIALELPGLLSYESKLKARKFVAEQADKVHVAEIKEYREKRSLSSNAYAWVLIDKLAEALSLDKTTVYRQAIKEIGGVSETVCVIESAVDGLRRGWAHNGLGWQSDTIPSKLDGCVNVVLYYGSSVYNSAQMQRLLDQLIQECKQLDIETATPAELKKMMDEWDARADEKVSDQ